MDGSILTSILLSISSLFCLGTGIAAFRRYSMTQSERLLTIGIAMIIIAVGIACSAIDTLPFLGDFHLDWVWYIGTTIGFFLLFLSSTMSSTEQFRHLKRWSIIAGILVITNIVLAPALPDLFGDRYLMAFFDGLRTLICALVFFRYLMLYTSKGTRFSLLLCLAFLFLAVGFVMRIPQVLDPVSWQIPLVDTILRIAGDILLFVAFIAG